jgi:Multicopper oxidase
MSKTSPTRPSYYHPASPSWMPRRNFLIGAGTAGMALGTALGRAYTQIATAPDYSLRIAPLRLELAPGKVIETFGYNGKVPGPVLRLREGRQVGIDIRNDTDIDDIVHWHGLYVPSEADGAMEEGSPMVGRGGAQRYTFKPFDALAKSAASSSVALSSTGSAERRDPDSKPSRGRVTLCS